MKKLLKGLVAVTVLMLALTACGSKSATKTFTHEDNGITTEMTYTYEGDKITRLDMKTVMPFASMMLEDKEQAEKTVETMKSAVQPVEGITNEYVIEGETIVMTSSVDYAKVDLEKISEIAGGMTIDPEQVTSMQKVEEALTAQGFTVK